jgi:hypothetical protein
MIIPNQNMNEIQIPIPIMIKTKVGRKELVTKRDD